jgi:hypothetical protein
MNTPINYSILLQEANNFGEKIKMSLSDQWMTDKTEGEAQHCF